MVKRLRKLCRIVLFCMLLLLSWGTLKMQIKAAPFSESPYVSFSPDGRGFTTNAGDTNWEWYTYGSKVSTGQEGTLPILKEGEHYYRYQREGEIPVSSWQVRHVAGMCIHNSYTDANHYHGVMYQRNNCMRRHYSGWVPICADCSEEITLALFYMSEDAAKSINSLDMSMAYYYLCPYCDNLEQGVELHSHNCLAVSANRYKVTYNPNGGSGYMASSIHMYNDEKLYEGNEVKPQQNLTKNSFSRHGYEFVGWNTNADGSGTFYRDGQEIQNLSALEGAEVVLYAQWRKSISTLYLDTGEGSYDARKGVLAFPGEYGDEISLEGAKVATENAVTITFDACGGEAVPAMKAQREFASFSIKNPMQGRFSEGKYTYLGPDGSSDYITVLYRTKSVILPEAKREGYSFGGWYFDAEKTLPAGVAGSEFTPSKDVTLYAGWTLLYLETKDNYTVNEGKGAVDLSWEMDAQEGKTYKVYQKKEGEEFAVIGEGFHVGEDISVEEYFEAACEKDYYEIPYTGYYRLTLGGAKGEDYQEYKGGNGGMVSANFYLEKGDRIRYMLGKTDGEPGGGKGSSYGSGGGYSALYINEKDAPALISGGGGGASLTENGMAGGLSESILDSMEGGDGVAGGGGGHHGGTAAILEQHFHTKGCKHTHEGTPGVYGGCYTVRTTCGSNSFTQYERSSSFYYGNKTWDAALGKYVSCFCPRCGSYSCAGHRDVHYGYRCNRCSTTYSSRPGACSAMKGYAVGCGRDESYICGYEEAQILRSVPAYGGSSFADETQCLSAEMQPGENGGNGYLKIESVWLGFHHEKNLSGVLAPDEHPPLAIETAKIAFIPQADKEILVRFERPKDMGTAYYHKVEAYDSRLGSLVCESNHTLNVLTGGVAGYYYCIDETKDTPITGSEEFLAQTGLFPQLRVPVEQKEYYLHVAPVDKAGNIGEAVHIKISDSEKILWPIYTGPILVGDSSGVYQSSEKEFFVKADGKTPISLSFEACMAGIARDNYQITEGAFVTISDENCGKLITKIPSLIPVREGVYTYEGAGLITGYEGDSPLMDGAFTFAERYRRAECITLKRHVTLSSTMHGTEIFLYPQVLAEHEKGKVSSDVSEDKQNGVVLRPDGEGPTIIGMEGFSGFDVLDLEKTKEIMVSLWAKDDDAGLSSFTVELWNEDNGSSKTYTDEDGDGEICVYLELTESVLNGDFSVTARATDRVGNSTVETKGMTGFYLLADIERILEPHEPVFQAGESGRLTVFAGGYVDKLRITFPEQMSARNNSLNKEFVYEIPMYEVMQEIDFMVPLYVPDGTYQIKVEAFKEGSNTQDYPKWVELTVRGSVLDDFRTRLR